MDECNESNEASHCDCDCEAGAVGATARPAWSQLGHLFGATPFRRRCHSWRWLKWLDWRLGRLGRLDWSRLTEPTEQIWTDLNRSEQTARSQQSIFPRSRLQRLQCSVWFSAACLAQMDYGLWPRRKYHITIYLPVLATTVTRTKRECSHTNVQQNATHWTMCQMSDSDSHMWMIVWCGALGRAGSQGL